MSSRPVMEAAVGAAVTTAAGAAIAAAGAEVTAAGAEVTAAGAGGETTGSNVHFRHHRCSLNNNRPATTKDDGPDLRRLGLDGLLVDATCSGFVVNWPVVMLFCTAVAESEVEPHPIFDGIILHVGLLPPH